MKLHPCPLLLLIHFALNSSVPGIDFIFFKKGVGEKYTYVGEKMGTNFPGSPNSMDFAAFSHTMGN